MWMQLGFLGAAIDSATSHLRASCAASWSFSTRSPTRSTAPSRFRAGSWRGPRGTPRSSPSPRSTRARSGGKTRGPARSGRYSSTASCRIPRPSSPTECSSRSARLHAADTCLFDLRSRREFATVAAELAAGTPVAAEVNGRRIRVVGTTSDRGQLRRGRQPRHQ